MINLRRVLNPFFVLAVFFFCNSSFALLNTPAITSPTNNATNINNKTNVTSNSVSGTFYYLFEMDSISTFKSGYNKKFSKVTVNNIQLDSLPFNKNHFVRVKVFNSALTDSSSWSATVKFTTYKTISFLSKNASYAVLGFSWNTNSVAKLEIQIDTSNLFNSSRFKGYISETLTTSYFNFKYTKTNQQYYIRYRSRYGSKKSEWVDGGTVISNKGFAFNYATTNDSFILKKNLQLITNYNGDTNVVYAIQIDTTITFNSINLFKTITSSNSFAFIAKPYRKYYIKIKMTYPGDIWYGDSIYIFNTARNSPAYASKQYGDVLFILPPNCNRGIVEIDTTLKFNSALKIKLDTSFALNPNYSSFSKYYLSIKRYHNMYMRYKAVSPEYELDWYCSNKKFMAPAYNVPVTDTHPLVRFNNLSGYNDLAGVVIEADTTVNFNSKLKIKNSYLIAKSDSIRTLKFGKNYFLRAKYFNANNDTTQWGNPFSFKTLDTVRIQSPNGSQYYFNSFNVSTDNVPGVKIYNWQLDTNLDFRTKVDLNSYRNYFTSNEMPRLVVGKKYYWRMRLISLVDTSKWSRIGSINLITSSDLPYPFLIYPPNNSTNIAPANINFLWKDNTGGIGSSYEFYITSPVTPLSIASVATNTIPLKNLMPNTTYTWYVLSYRKNYNSEVPILSQRFTFTTSSISDIAGLDKNATLLVYPNPAYSTLSIQLKTGDKIESLNIRNIEGKLIYEQNFVNSNLFEIDINAFKKGMFIASCQSNRGVYVSKFIKE